MTQKAVQGAEKSQDGKSPAFQKTGESMALVVGIRAGAGAGPEGGQEGRHKLKCDITQQTFCLNKM